MHSLRPWRAIAISAIALACFALAGVSLVAFTQEQTRARIAANERSQLLRALNQLIAPERYDNALLEDRREVVDAKWFSDEGGITVYRARRDGKPVALLIATEAPDGYSGAIKLLIGINYDGSLSGVRVQAHRETPGLGDAIEVRRSDWILQFTGLSLQNPSLHRWKVKRDGGEFDQFTGATITPRAVVGAVRETLLYYRIHRDELFS